MATSFHHCSQRHGCYHEDDAGVVQVPCDGFTYALFFSITSMSTAAQVAPKTDVGPLIFTTVWIFIGIPLYGAVMGFISETWIAHYSRVATREAEPPPALSCAPVASPGTTGIMAAHHDQWHLHPCPCHVESFSRSRTLLWI